MNGLIYTHKRRIISLRNGDYTLKRRDLIKQLENDGWKFKRSGGNHDIYEKAGFPNIQIPRHTEINEYTAQGILKKARLK